MLCACVASAESSVSCFACSRLSCFECLAVTLAQSASHRAACSRQLACSARFASLPAAARVRARTAQLSCRCAPARA
eukprot:5588778-Prymnesium_polylepis.1